MVGLGLKQLMTDSGIDLERDGVRIVCMPGADGPGVSFDFAAARSLANGEIDGFFANAMGAENALRQGVGDTSMVGEEIGAQTQVAPTNIWGLVAEQ